MNGGRTVATLLAALLAASISPTVSALYAGERAHASRARADMRSLATALESYRVDHGHYPSSEGSPEFRLPAHLLTTPVAYLIAELQDPFKSTVILHTSSVFIAALHSPVLLIPFAVWLMGTLVLTALMAYGSRRRGQSFAVLKSAPLAALESAIAVVIFMALFAPSGVFFQYYEFPRQNRAWNSEYLGFNYFSGGADHFVLQSVGPNGIRDLEDLSPAIQEEDPDEAEQLLIPFTYDPTNGRGSAGDIFRYSVPETEEPGH